MIIITAKGTDELSIGKPKGRWLLRKETWLLFNFTQYKLVRHSVSRTLNKILEYKNFDLSTMLTSKLINEEKFKS